MDPSTETAVIQKKEFRMVGLSRSGNHAVINWIIQQLEGTYCFLNCTEPKHNPYGTARPLSRGGSCYLTNISDFSLEQEQKGNFSQKDYLLYNHEDCFLGSLNKNHEREHLQQWLGHSGNRMDILILRDPFNLFASRIKAGFIRGFDKDHGSKRISLKTLQRIYKQHAREFLNEKKYLRNKTCINFNLWASEKDYRKTLTEKLEIPFSDQGFLEVPKVAGGSSFDGTSLSGNAHKMGVNNRWRTFVSDEEYWSLFDAELVALTRKIFGDLPSIAFAEEKKLLPAG